MDNDVANNTQYEWSSSFTPNVSVNDQGQVTITYQTYSEVAVTAKSKKIPKLFGELSVLPKSVDIRWRHFAGIEYRGQQTMPRFRYVCGS